jgi:hypothetical protein
MSKAKIMKDNSNAGGGMVYCLGVIGALVYYFQNADTFGQYVLGLLKSFVWPAMIVYKALGFLGL